MRRYPANRRDAREPATARRRMGGLLLAAVAALTGWDCWLGLALPSTEIHQAWSANWSGRDNWQLTWVGLDSLEALGLVGTGTALLLRHWTAAVAALLTLPLFVVNAWFEVMTTTSRLELWEAAAMAVLVELPTAAAMGWVAWSDIRTLRNPLARTGQDTAPADSTTPAWTV